MAAPQLQPLPLPLTNIPTTSHAAEPGAEPHAAQQATSRIEAEDEASPRDPDLEVEAGKIADHEALGAMNIMILP